MTTSTTAMKLTNRADTGMDTNDELEAAFRALATFVCSKCMSPLSKEIPPSKSPWHRPNPEREDPHICCNTVHCPYCGKPSSARCRHIVAFKEYGHWSIPGFRGKAAKMLPTSAPAHGVPDSQMMDFEDDQKKTAFRSATPFLNLLYSEGFACKADRAVPLAPTLGPHFFRGDRCLEAYTRGRCHRYHFSKDPDSARAEALQIFKDLEEGTVRMNDMTPSAARYLLREIEPPTATSHSVSTIQFSPDGRLILIGLPGEGQLWDVETGEPLHRLSLGLSEEMSQYDNLTAVFSQEGTRLALAASKQWGGYDSRDGGHKHVTDTILFDVASGAALGRVARVDLPTRITGVPTEAFLAGGMVLARVRGRFVHLAPVSKEGEVALGSSRPVRLPHRAVLRHCAFSPDGLTFATLQVNYDSNWTPSCRILLWRLPKVEE